MLSSIGKNVYFWDEHPQRPYAYHIGTLWCSSSSRIYWISSGSHRDATFTCVRGEFFTDSSEYCHSICFLRALGLGRVVCWISHWWRYSQDLFVDWLRPLFMDYWDGWRKRTLHYISSLEKNGKTGLRRFRTSCSLWSIDHPYCFLLLIDHLYCFLWSIVESMYSRLSWIAARVDPRCKSTLSIAMPTEKTYISINVKLGIGWRRSKWNAFRC